MDSGTREREIGELSIRVHAYQRDFLGRFGQNDCFNVRPDGVLEDPGEVELSLGLSLGGCFGVDPKEKIKLGRSSSIASVLMLPREGERDGQEHDFFAGAPLMRASSLPAENEEELRLRKELQCLKRLEAKRKRSEKRNGRYDSLVEDLKASQSKMRRFVGGDQLNGVKNGLTAQLGLRDGAMGGVELPKSYTPAPGSQGSIGSQGSCCSGLSDSGVQPPVLGFETPRLSTSSEDQSPSTSHSLPDNGGPQKHTFSREKGDLTPRKTACVVNGRGVSRDAERSMMEEMPFVSTKGDGPNGRRIEGFLYKYRKGEEVRIVCVCHGSFLTPAEFVKHAGGGDVAHPLRHIVVNPFPSSLF